MRATRWGIPSLLLSGLLFAGCETKRPNPSPAPEERVPPAAPKVEALPPAARDVAQAVRPFARSPRSEVRPMPRLGPDARELEEGTHYKITTQGTGAMPGDPETTAVVLDRSVWDAQTGKLIDSTLRSASPRRVRLSKLPAAYQKLLAQVPGGSQVAVKYTGRIPLLIRTGAQGQQVMLFEIYGYEQKAPTTPRLAQVATQAPPPLPPASVKRVGKIQYVVQETGKGPELLPSTHLVVLLSLWRFANGKPNLEVSNRRFAWATKELPAELQGLMRGRKEGEKLRLWADDLPGLALPLLKSSPGNSVIDLHLVRVTP